MATEQGSYFTPIGDVMLKASQDLARPVEANLPTEQWETKAIHDSLVDEYIAYGFCGRKLTDIELEGGRFLSTFEIWKSNKLFEADRRVDFEAEQEDIVLWDLEPRVVHARALDKLQEFNAAILEFDLDPDSLEYAEQQQSFFGRIVEFTKLGLAIFEERRLNEGFESAFSMTELDFIAGLNESFDSELTKKEEAAKKQAEFEKNKANLIRSFHTSNPFNKGIENIGELAVEFNVKFSEWKAVKTVGLRNSKSSYFNRLADILDNLTHNDILDYCKEQREWINRQMATMQPSTVNYKKFEGNKYDIFCFEQVAAEAKKQLYENENPL